MSQTWSIRIVPDGNSARFDPDVFGIGEGQPLIAEEGDLVSWNNQTGKTQMIAVFQAGTETKSFISNWIDPHTSSSPGYVILETDIDTAGAPKGTGTVRYITTMGPGFPPSTGPEIVEGTITVVGVEEAEEP